MERANGRKLKMIRREMNGLKAKKASIFTKVVVIALIAYATVSLISLRSQIQNAEARQESLQQQVDAVSAENAAKEYDIANIDDPETIESIARNKLGLVRPDEIIFYDVNN